MHAHHERGACGRWGTTLPTWCKSDVTLRRLQSFNPEPGSVICWQLTHGASVHSNSFTYGGGPITIPNVRIYQDGSLLEVFVCPDEEELTDPDLD